MSNYTEIDLDINLSKGVHMMLPANGFLVGCVGVLILSISWRFFAAGWKDFRKK